MDDLGLGDIDMALIAGLRESRMMCIVRCNTAISVTIDQLPVFSQLGMDIIEALYHTVQAITDRSERLGLGMYLGNELRTRGAGYVAWKILNSCHRESWVPEEIP
jgi:hypothetical protein